MILTNCAVCAAPLAHDAPHRCVRCQLRYCSQDCQQHYWRSGHQENCEIIHRGGDAEQYHAEQKDKWAVAAAVVARAVITAAAGHVAEPARALPAAERDAVAADEPGGGAVVISSF